jgi:hypothetical protein
MKFLLLLIAHVFSLTPLQKLQEKEKMFEITEAEYMEFTQGNRNYNLFVLLTTTHPQHNCEPCFMIKNELQLVSSSIKSDPIFFATLDFKRSPQIFQQVVCF